MKNQLSGFTMVELLVTIAIITTLGSLTFAGVRCAREKSRTVVEINAARNLIAGYLSYATEHNGQVLAGYQTDPAATNLDGDLLEFPINARYPWRLAPSVPSVKGVLVFNGTEAMLHKKDRDYRVSAAPNLGLNATLVGGHFGSGSPLPPTSRLVASYGKFYLSHLTESDAPGKLIVFASARSGKNQPGYFEVRPPNLTNRVWSSQSFAPEADAADHGFVDFRWGGKAVVAMLGGNVELKAEAELRDMQRWSHQATRANDRDFMIRRAE